MEYEWTIDLVSKTIEDNCIISVTLKCTLKNVDFDGYTFISVNLPPKDDANFIDYNSLTSDQVLQWCWDNIESEEKADQEYTLLMSYEAESRNKTLDIETPSWA